MRELNVNEMTAVSGGSVGSGSRTNLFWGTVLRELGKFALAAGAALTASEAYDELNQPDGPGGLDDAFGTGAPFGIGEGGTVNAFDGGVAYSIGNISYVDYFDDGTIDSILTDHGNFFTIDGGGQFGAPDGTPDEIFPNK